MKNKKNVKDFTDIYFMVDNNDNNPDLDSFEVSPSYNQLSIQIDTLNDTLVSQDRLLKRAVREVKELKSRLECSSFELELLRSRVRDEECDSCLVVMSELAEL